MGWTIIIASFVVYALTVMVCLFVVTDKENFDSVDKMLRWVYREYPSTFTPVVNTFLLFGGIVVCVLTAIVFIIKKMIKKWV